MARKTDPVGLAARRRSTGGARVERAAKHAAVLQLEPGGRDPRTARSRRDEAVGAHGQRGRPHPRCEQTLERATGDWGREDPLLAGDDDVPAGDRDATGHRGSHARALVRPWFERRAAVTRAEDEPDRCAHDPISTLDGDRAEPRARPRSSRGPPQRGRPRLARIGGTGVDAGLAHDLDVVSGIAHRAVGERVLDGNERIGWPDLLAGRTGGEERGEHECDARSAAEHAGQRTRRARGLP